MKKCITCKKENPSKDIRNVIFCSRECANAYARDYYSKHRDKLNKYQIDYHTKKRAELNRPGRAVALKAWETRRRKEIGMGKRWSNQEIEFLRKNFKQKKCDEMGKILKRSGAAVQKVCATLGLCKYEKRI